MKESILKYLFSATGGIMAFIAPTIEYAVICTFAVTLDVLSAYRLSRRVKRKNPSANDGKFKSSYARRVLDSIIKIYTLILLAHLIDTRLLIMFDGIFLANYVAAIFSFIQVWSILENESSEQDANWARVLQKIMVNKAERHFNIENLSKTLNNESTENIHQGTANN